VLEIIAFILVCNLIGVTLAILLIILTSAIGFSQLKHRSQEIMRKMQRAQSDPVFAAEVLRNVDSLHSIACILLILPGFLTDIAAILLMIPQIRKIIIKKFSKSTTHQQTSHGNKTFEGKFTRHSDNDDFITKKDEHDKDI
jgi:UPF0716 protein FxsA